MFVCPLSEFDENINISLVCTLNVKLESEDKGKRLKVAKFASSSYYIYLIYTKSRVKNVYLCFYRGLYEYILVGISNFFHCLVVTLRLAERLCDNKGNCLNTLRVLSQASRKSRKLIFLSNYYLTYFYLEGRILN